MALFNKKSKIKANVSSADIQSTLHKNLDFTATEQYKLLRTNIDFTLPEGEKCAVIGVTSSMRGEGKSTTSINLSYVLAERGSRVLLVDGDLRLPTVAKKMEIDGKSGLTDMLMGRGKEIEHFKSELLDRWYILPSGEIPPNPSELLGSGRMKNLIEQLKDFFDYIVVDLPPVNIVSDAISISPMLTGMIVVIREDHTEKKELERCIRQLKLSGVNVLGCVMNSAKREGGSYGKYKKKYKYYKYGYGYGYEYGYGKHKHTTEARSKDGKDSDDLGDIHIKGNKK